MSAYKLHMYTLAALVQNNRTAQETKLTSFSSTNDIVNNNADIVRIHAGYVALCHA